VTPLDYVFAGIHQAFLGNPAFTLGPLVISWAIVMVVSGFFTGVLIGATPGLSGPFAMAMALPVLISSFGYTPDALLPVMGFLVGIMKGATIGGAVPAILFNTPGTPDAVMTTLDGYPMARNGQGGKALRVAQFAAVTGDTFSDLVLFTCAPFLAFTIEEFLGLPEKAALMILSLSFVAAVVGSNPAKGLFAACFGLFVAAIGTGADSYPRLSLGMDSLASGFPTIAVFVGVLIVGELFVSFDQLWRKGVESDHYQETGLGDNTLSWPERRKLMPYISISMCVGTIIGALPGIGTTLAAALGYTAGRNIHKGEPDFGKGAPGGVASTEAASSAVSGANLIPALSLGIPGNVAAVFIIVAADTIGGFNPGPSVFKFSTENVNSELVIAFGLFTLMMVANITNWFTGASFMRLLGGLVHIPAKILLPAVLLLTLTSTYVQEGHMIGIYVTLGFGIVGYLMRLGGIPILPMVIAFILTSPLETAIRNAFEASGSDPWFLLRSPIAVLFLVMSLVLLSVSGRLQGKKIKPA
jgi:putative tricarboxylic transport membrane protein